MTDARVLLADDSEEMLAALTELLDAAAGLVVVACVMEATSALERARTLHPDVAVVDVRMPGGGPDLVRGLLRETPTLRVIGLSSSDHESTRAAMLAAGASIYLVKGDPDVDLVSSIHAVLGLPSGSGAQPG